MVGKPKYDVETVRQWRVTAKRLRPNHHLTRGRISHLVAQEFGVPASTVWHYLFGAGRQKAIYRYKTYDLNYHRLIRHLDETLPTLYDGSPALGLAEISDRLAAYSSGIRMHERTIERIVSSHAGPHGPPLIPSGEAGKYRLSPSYYSSPSHTEPSRSVT